VGSSSTLIGKKLPAFVNGLANELTYDAVFIPFGKLFSIVVSLNSSNVGQEPLPPE
jgi:hypothetical protein